MVEGPTAGERLPCRRSCYVVVAPPPLSLKAERSPSPLLRNREVLECPPGPIRDSPEEELPTHLKKTLSYSTRLVPPFANGSWRRLQAQQLSVTLAVTLQAGPAVTLGRTRPKVAQPIEGDKVEEVEEPPFPSPPGDTHPRRRTRITRQTHACAHTHARVTSAAESLYPDYGNRPQFQFLRR